MKLLFLSFLLAWGTAGRAATAEESIPRELTLQKCLELALVHSPELRIASEQFLAAEGKGIRLRAILYPTVDAQGLTTPLTFYVQIQETFYSRETAPRLRLSRLTHEQALLNYRQALVDVVFRVRQAFITELGAQEQTELTHRIIAQREAAVKTAQQLFDAGHAQRSDILPMQVLVNLARQNDALATLAGQQGTIALRTLLGVDLPVSVRFKGELMDRAPADLDVGKLSAQALRDRQDLKLLENARLSATQQIEIDLKNAYPVVGFSSNSAIQPPSFLPGAAAYDLERNESEPQTQRNVGNTQLPLSLYLTWTIFDGGELRGVKISEQAQLASQAVAIDALQRAIPGEVAAAVAAILNERKTLRLLAPDSPDAVRREAQVDYDAGRARLLDKVNLESDLVRQQQLRLASQIRLSLAAAALDHALGRGLDAKATPQH